MRLFIKYLGMHLKTSLEYKLSFILLSISQGLIMLIELFTIYALFSKFKLLDLYDINSLLMGFSVIWLGFSISETFARGFDNFSKLIVNGNFDLLLVRPRSLFLQIIGTDICYEKISRVLFALGLYIYSIVHLIDAFTISKVLLLITMAVGCSLIITSLFILGATLAFYTVQGLEAVNIFTNGTRQVVQYPIGIYNKVIKFIFTFIIPISLVNYYPIDYLCGNKTNFYYNFMPFVSLIPFILSIQIFRIGLKKYTSTGS